MLRFFKSSMRKSLRLFFCFCGDWCGRKSRRSSSRLEAFSTLQLRTSVKKISLLDRSFTMINLLVVVAVVDAVAVEKVLNISPATT